MDSEKGECWGTYRFWCHSRKEPSSINGTKFVGMKCEGHFKTMSLPIPFTAEAPTVGLKDQRVTICEGGFVWMSGKVGTSLCARLCSMSDLWVPLHDQFSQAWIRK